MQNVKVSLPIIHCSSSRGFAAAISSLQYSTLSVTVKLSNSWCYVILVAIFAFLHKSKIKVVFQSMGVEDLVILNRNRHWVFEWFKKSELYWIWLTLSNPGEYRSWYKWYKDTKQTLMMLFRAFLGLLCVTTKSIVLKCRNKCGTFSSPIYSSTLDGSEHNDCLEVMMNVMITRRSYQLVLFYFDKATGLTKYYEW